MFFFKHEGLRDAYGNLVKLMNLDSFDSLSLEILIGRGKNKFLSVGSLINDIKYEENLNVAKLLNRFGQKPLFENLLEDDHLEERFLSILGFTGDKETIRSSVFRKSKENYYLAQSQEQKPKQFYYLSVFTYKRDFSLTKIRTICEILKVANLSGHLIINFKFAGEKLRVLSYFIAKTNDPAAFGDRLRKNLGSIIDVSPNCFCPTMCGSVLFRTLKKMRRTHAELLSYFQFEELNYHSELNNKDSQRDLEYGSNGNLESSKTIGDVSFLLKTLELKYNKDSRNLYELENGIIIYQLGNLDSEKLEKLINILRTNPSRLIIMFNKISDSITFKKRLGFYKKQFKRINVVTQMSELKSIIEEEKKNLVLA